MASSRVGTRWWWRCAVYRQRLRRPSNRTDSLTLIDWAYQSVSGESIHVGDKGTTAVPEPSGLGLMALGALGVAALRRRRSRDKKHNAEQAN